MGKYGFDYTRLEALEKQVKDMANEVSRLTAENKRLRQSHKEPYAREIVSKLDESNYMYLFGIESNQTGKGIHFTKDKNQAYKVFKPFWANFKRILIPMAYENEKNKDGKSRIHCKELNDLTEEAYDIVCETLSAVVDTMANGKRKIQKSDDDLLEFFREKANNSNR